VSSLARVAQKRARLLLGVAIVFVFVFIIPILGVILLTLS